MDELIAPDVPSSGGLNAFRDEKVLLIPRTIVPGAVAVVRMPATGCWYDILGLFASDSPVSASPSSDSVRFGTPCALG